MTINKNLYNALKWALSELESLNDQTKQLEQINQQLPYAKKALAESENVLEKELREDRKYFAAMAMQGLLTNPKYAALTEYSTEEKAFDAVFFADALINQLNKPINDKGNKNSQALQ